MVYLSADQRLILAKLSHTGALTLPELAAESTIEPSTLRLAIQGLSIRGLVSAGDEFGLTADGRSAIVGAANETTQSVSELLLLDEAPLDSVEVSSMLDHLLGSGNDGAGD